MTPAVLALGLLAGCGTSSGGEELVLSEPTAQGDGGSGGTPGDPSGGDGGAPGGDGNGQPDDGSGDGAPDDDDGEPDDGSGDGAPDDDGGEPGDGGEDGAPDDGEGEPDDGPRVVVVGPGEDVQVAANGLRPGDTLRLGPGVYQIRTPVPTEGLQGLRIATSGTPDAPILIEGAPDGSSVIDQGRDGTRSDAPAAGLVLDCASHVVVRGLTIRNVDLAGVTTALSGCVSRDITLERLHVHDVHGTGPVGALRIANAQDVRIRNNRLRRVFDGGNEGAEPLPASGDTGTIVVERNTFEAVDAGVAVAVRGAAGVADLSIGRNAFIASGVGFLARAGAAGGNLRDVVLAANLFRQVDRAVELDLGEAPVESSAFTFRRNTVAGTTDAAWLQAGTSGVTFIENVFADLGGDVIVTFGTGGSSAAGAFEEIDGNVYDDASPVLAWTLGLGGDDEVRFVGFDAWRNAGAETPGLDGPPDAGGVAGALRFVAPETGDYALAPGSPGSASSGDGGDPGAFRDGERPGAEAGPD